MLGGKETITLTKSYYRIKTYINIYFSTNDIKFCKVHLKTGRKIYQIQQYNELKRDIELLHHPNTSRY